MRRGFLLLSVASWAGCTCYSPAKHRAWPEIPRGDGGEFANPLLVTVVPANHPDREQLLDFGDALTQSHWLEATGQEYGAWPATGARLVGPPLDPNAANYNFFNDTEVRNYLSQVADAGPAMSTNTVYLLYLLPGQRLYMGDIAELSVEFCGYHLFAPLGPSSFAAAVSGRCESGRPDYTEPDSFTHLGSHEVIESFTDYDSAEYMWGLTPEEQQQPWTTSVFASFGSEVGDLCTGTDFRETSDAGNWNYTRSFSNGAARRGDDPCVPARTEPYFNVSVDQDWYPVKHGSPLTIRFTAWSTERRAQWRVSPQIWSSTYALSATALDISGSFVRAQLDGGCGNPVWMNNGDQASLDVTIPSSAGSGDWAVVAMQSDDMDLDCNPPAGADYAHYWPVGIYVP